MLVGHSFGSFIVSAYAMRQPAEGSRGVVLVDPATEWLTDDAASGSSGVRGARHLSRIGALLAQVGVVRACLALLTGGAPGAPRHSSDLRPNCPHGRSNAWSGKCGSFHRKHHPIVQALWCDPKCFHAMADHLLVLERDRDSLAAVAPAPGRDASRGDFERRSRA